MGGIFHFNSFFIELRANNGNSNQTLPSVASDLDLRCLQMSLKKDARLIWIKNMSCLFVLTNYNASLKLRNT